MGLSSTLIQPFESSTWYLSSPSPLEASSFTRNVAIVANANWQNLATEHASWMQFSWSSSYC
ncbi:hypothetical protein FA13DRAFT_1733276 [Coprinellus micaceus]|uniref:Uncharacterized protein n=1 Tax=Coprinellus micaceus TaxID=71717 RepID=A0A4Y7TBA2_COPMI|nr:hypothetical protein FA13DRAFT_1733276 [Coprinellus micaceus]